MLLQRLQLLHNKYPDLGGQAGKGSFVKSGDLVLRIA